jgi:hypothetical protein
MHVLVCSARRLAWGLTSGRRQSHLPALRHLIPLAGTAGLMLRVSACASGTAHQASAIGARPRHTTTAAAATFTAAGTAAAAPAASTPRCATSGLVVWLDVPPGNDFAGGAEYYLEFTNLSGHACTLAGYPGVSAVGLSGGQLGSPAGWGAPVTTTVRLASGATATARLQINDPGVYGTRCLLPPPWKQPWRPGTLPTAAGLRVYPPNQFASKVIPYPFRACAHAGPVYIHAGPVTPGGPPE